MELPMVNKTTNYHVVEYQQDQNMELFMRSCGTQNCLSDYGYPRCARPGYHLHVVLCSSARAWECFRAEAASAHSVSVYVYG